MPTKWTVVYVTLDTGIGLLARWDGEQWWMADRDIPIVNRFVLNWRTVN